MRQPTLARCCLLLGSSLLLSSRGAAAFECQNLVLNGGFEDGMDHWETMTTEGNFVRLNNGTVFPFPGRLPPVPPMVGQLDVYCEHDRRGMIKLFQTVILPPDISFATFSWMDRIFSLRNFTGEGDVDMHRARARVCLGDAHGGIVDVWTTNPGDNWTQPGPNSRSVDVTHLLVGKTQVDVVFEQEDFEFLLNMFWDEIALTVCTGPPPEPVEPPSKSGGGVGDPHFKNWLGEWYDFHGICDLVLVQSEGFGNDLGLTIHVRTKARYEWSYIEAVAIQIGDDILEVGSWGEYWYNGVDGAEMPLLMGGRFPVIYTRESKKRQDFVIRTGQANDEAIVVRTVKDIVSIMVENATAANFGSSVGLMGNFTDGSLLARDGVTVVEDHKLLGQMWQVLESEPQLFQSPTKNQDTCVHPTATGRRRLGETTIAKEEAEKACAQHEPGEKRDMCIFDVLAMGDLEVAQVYGAS